MADLFSHFAAARLPAAFVRDPRVAALVILGTFLPDLAAKGLYWILRAPSDFVEPTHSLVGVVLLSYLACLFVEERLRRAGFLAILVGGLVHVAVDVLKHNLGMGAIRLLYPFSIAGQEVGILDPVNVVPLLPFDLVVLLIAGWIGRKVRRVQQ